MQIKPTRMGLLLTKKKLKLASKGHKLLKEKRDALVMDFFKVLKEIKKLRLSIAEELIKAEKALSRAQAVSGDADIERISLATSTGVDVDFSVKSVVGVKLPEIKDIRVDHQWYSAVETSVELDAAIVRYRKIFKNILKLSEKQLAFQRLADAIKKTKRKVNSLEYNIIPRLEYTKSSIAFKLEERDRESFTRLKKIKEKTQNKDAEEASKPKKRVVKKAAKKTAKKKTTKTLLKTPAASSSQVKSRKVKKTSKRKNAKTR